MNAPKELVSFPMVCSVTEERFNVQFRYSLAQNSYIYEVILPDLSAPPPPSTAILAVERDPVEQPEELKESDSFSIPTHQMNWEGFECFCGLTSTTATLWVRCGRCQEYICGGRTKGNWFVCTDTCGSEGEMRSGLTEVAGSEGEEMKALERRLRLEGKHLLT